MILSTQGFIRVGLLVFFTVVLQVSAMERITIFGGQPDLLPLVVAAVAIYAGSIPGAACGFVAGFTLDMMISDHLGASSLVLTAIGYGIGRYREVRDPAHGLMPIPLGAAATASYAIGTAAVGFMLSIDTSATFGVISDMIVLLLLNTIIALPVFAVVRRVLGPTLAIDPLERRRRRQGPSSTGPIGLRGLGIGR
ncbi:MAG: rod shape-determining protein MreD [Thermoleophilaceae bacterium]|nr:rod shape-determining protein MreD [Thermoleophilaceae bacterium]